MHTKNCPLCDEINTTQLEIKDVRQYHLCENCKLIFVSEEFRPQATQAEERYRRHQNNSQDSGYVNFLMQAITPALPFLNAGMTGLDYGCGPTATLSEILKTNGLRCDNYDPIFFPDLPGNKYDFVFSTECFEHFIFPKNDITKIVSLIKKDSLLVIMTDAWSTLQNINSWYYLRDFTHVSFYHAETFAYICKAFGFALLFSNLNRVFILRKT